MLLRVLSPILFSVAFLLPCVTMAQEARTPVKENGQFKAFDRDNDGRLNREELPDQAMKDLDGEGNTDAGSGYHGISSTWTHINFNATDRFYIYLFAVPRDELNLEIFLVSLRNCRVDEEYNKNFVERMGIAVEEDRVVIEKLDPPIPSKEAVGEFIVPADDILMNYRKQRMEWEANGWRMNLEEMEKNRNRVAYAIPSPARGDDPGDWAVTSVPLLSR